MGKSYIKPCIKVKGMNNATLLAGSLTQNSAKANFVPNMESSSAKQSTWSNDSKPSSLWDD